MWCGYNIVLRHPTLRQMNGHSAAVVLLLIHFLLLLYGCGGPEDGVNSAAVATVRLQHDLCVSVVSAEGLDGQLLLVQADGRAGGGKDGEARVCGSPGIGAGADPLLASRVGQGRHRHHS